MSRKLEDFRLESYDERILLLAALRVYRSRYQHDTKLFEALVLRLAHTQCQPGGCEYCGGPV